MECIYTEDFEGDERPAPAEYIELESTKNGLNSYQ